MRLERLENCLEVARRCADLVAECLRDKPQARLVLPAGGTPLPLFEELRRRDRAGRVDFRRCHVFQLDEMVGVPPEDARSFHAFLRDNLLDGLLLDGLDRAEEYNHLIDGRAADPVAEIERHASVLQQAGGADLAVLGLGLNGHVAFNEPGSELAAPARRVGLHPVTRNGLVGQFAADEVPQFGITLGMADIAAAQAVCLMVTGASKAAIFRAVLEQEAAAERPASLLLGHQRLTVVVDRAAAALLENEHRTGSSSAS